MGSGRNRCFGVVSFFLPDIALSSVPSGADTALFACHRTIGRVSAASGGSGTSVRRFPHSILLLRRGWPDHNGCRAVALGSGGVSFVGSVHGTLGVDSYGVGGGLGGRKAMRIELSAFRHNRFLCPCQLLFQISYSLLPEFKIFVAKSALKGMRFRACHRHCCFSHTTTW